MLAVGAGTNNDLGAALDRLAARERKMRHHLVDVRGEYRFLNYPMESDGSAGEDTTDGQR